MQPIYDFIAEAQDESKPFMVWYAPFLPHTPHTPPERLLDKYRDKTPHLHVAKYFAMVDWFDAQPVVELAMHSTCTWPTNARLGKSQWTTAIIS